MIKTYLKTIYTYFFNWRKILYFKKFGKKSFLGRRCQLNKCNGGRIEISDNVRIGNDARFSLYQIKNSNFPEIKIKENCYIGNHVTFMTAGKIAIEDEVLIASYVSIIGHNHGINPEDELSYRYQELTTKPIVIKQKTWIAERVCIMPGVTIGKKCIIGAGSIVTKDIPDYCVAVGNPAKVIKKYDFESHIWKNS